LVSLVIVPGRPSARPAIESQVPMFRNRLRRIVQSDVLQPSAVATEVTALGDAPLTVRAQFLEIAPAFVEGVLARMKEAREAAAPSLASGARALRLLTDAPNAPTQGANAVSPQVSVRGLPRGPKKPWT
jgi:hypothetical protein